MTDLLGPADAGATPTLTTTTDVATPYAGDTWYKDCTDGASGDGTDIVAKWLNRLMQQLRVAIRKGDVEAANTYENMLSWAIQSGNANWVDFSGTANRLTASAPNAPIKVTHGTLIRGYVHTPDNTGAVTFNWNGLTPGGDGNGAPVLLVDGSDCTGGEVKLGGRLLLMWDGASWTMLNALPLSWLLPKIPPQNPYLITGPGAVIHGLWGRRYGATPTLYDFPGMTGYWRYDSPTGFINFVIGAGPYSAITIGPVSDARWTGGAVPAGTWTIVGAAAHNINPQTIFVSGFYVPDEILLTFQRTA